MREETLLPTEPMVTQFAFHDWAQEREDEGPRAQAQDTPFRFSSAGACSRQLAYRAMRAEETNPFDLAGHWVTKLGNFTHEFVQNAAKKRFPNAIEEKQGVIYDSDNLPLASGHADLIIPEGDLQAVYPEWDGGDASYELKSMGGFKYKKQVGVNGYRRSAPEGPATSAIIQAGLNAKANDCDTLILGSVATEAISRGAAKALGFDENARIVSEWVIAYDEVEEQVEDEIDRWEWIRNMVDASEQVPREYEEKGKVLTLDPTASRQHWTCEYCAFRDRCVSDGA